MHKSAVSDIRYQILAASSLVLISIANAQAQWTAFNDYAPGYGTASNATVYGTPGLSASGPLKDIANGATVSATVAVTSTGTVGVLLPPPPEHAARTSRAASAHRDRIRPRLSQTQ